MQPLVDYDVDYKTLQFDSDKQTAFIEKYQNLKVEAEEAQEEILFMDAVHPTQSAKFACGWIKKSMDKVVKTTGSRTRLNIVGALSLKIISRAPSLSNTTPLIALNIVGFLLGRHFPRQTII